MRESKWKYEAAVKRIREILMSDDLRDNKYLAICRAMDTFMPPIVPTTQQEPESNAN